ncbi:hypothetical protein AB6A23_00565 [Paenibacillus tarimensis]
MMEIVMIVIKYIAAVMKGIFAPQSKPGKTSCLGLIYSFEAHVIKEQPVTVLPGRMKGAPIPLAERRRQRNPQAEWQAWRENNRLLFQSSA